MERTGLRQLCDNLNLEDLSPDSMIIFCRQIVRSWVEECDDINSDIIYPFIAIEDETSHLLHDVEDRCSKPIPVAKPAAGLTGAALEQEREEILSAYGPLFREAVATLRRYLAPDQSSVATEG